MRVDVLLPDAAPGAAPLASPAQRSASPFATLVDAAGAILDGADRAEHAFAAHRGGLQEMIVERARADIALQVAATAAQRATQGISSLLGMQI